jgi:hypothetical protein
MTTFPALTPSSRVFTPGEYPATAFNGYSGAQNRVRHSNVFLASQLRLTFKAASEADMLTIWRHYAGTQGNYESFELSPEALSDVSSTDYVPGVYRWIYAGPGVVEDLPCGGHNISLTLETVPPVAASVVGSRFRINLLLATGGAVSTDTSGIAGVIELGLMAGDAFEAQNGLNESIELGLTTGDAFGGIIGLHESIELVLDAGAAIGDVQVGGVSEAIELALTTGPGSVASAAGINEAIDLVLVGGVATEEDAGITDPDFASVSLLLPFDGADGSTTFTDASSAGRTATRFGDAQISTAQSKFGGASGLFDGSADYITFAPATDLQFNADFTIECWVRTASTADMMVGSSSSDNNTQVFRLNQAGAGRLSFFLNGTQVFNAVAAGITTNTWHHLAISRNGSSTRMFVDGVQIGSTSPYSGTFRMDVIGTFFSFGSRFGNDYNGYIDDLRITKGIARYTANFTPPTAPFPTS